MRAYPGGPIGESPSLHPSKAKQESTHQEVSIPTPLTLTRQVRQWPVPQVDALAAASRSPEPLPWLHQPTVGAPWWSSRPG
jgi:hypothetical protein